MDARVESVLNDILDPNSSLQSNSHTQWVKRELIKLFHMELELEKRESELKKKDQQRKKSRVYTNTNVQTQVPNTSES